MKTISLLIVLVAVSITFSESMLFLHHSCGNNLIEEGNVRFWIDSLNAVHGTDYEFWDHGYNYQGLRDPEGVWLGYNWNVPDDDTYACGFARIFHQEVDTLTCPNFFSHVIDSSELFAFKSCFPACEIDPDDTTYDLTDSCHQTIFNYKRLYRHIRNIIDTYPGKMFVALTPPALVPPATTPEQAARARHFAVWLTDTFPYEDGSHPNLSVFDFWTLLAENDPSAPDYNCLREEYRQSPGTSDSHPNELANQTIGSIFAEFLYNQFYDFLSVGAKKTLPKSLDIVAYPNPFNSSCAITMNVGAGSKPAQIGIYDLRGNIVAPPCGAGAPLSPLVRETEQSVGDGQGGFVWQPDKSITSGMYLVRVIDGSRILSKKLVFIK